MAAGSRKKPRHVPRAVRTIGKCGKIEAPGSIGAGSERGRRRTRQDQISLGLWIAGEIADPGGSAPNEENLFLLPDRVSKERTLLKGRSSRLT
jgi:hypothetical protein